MPAPRSPRLRHVPVRVRVTVDVDKWIPAYGNTKQSLPDDVRDYIVDQLQQVPAAKDGAILHIRRDGI